MKKTKSTFATFLIFALILSSYLTIIQAPTVKAQTSSASPITRVQGPSQTIVDNTTLIPYNQNGYDYVTANASYQFAVKKNSAWGDGVFYSVNSNGTTYSLTYQAQDYSYRDVYGSQDYLTSIQNVVGTVNQNNITFVNPFPNVNLTYSAMQGALKENYVISALDGTPASYLTAPITLDFGGYLKYPNLSLYLGNGTSVNATSDFTTSQQINFVTPQGVTAFYLPVPIATDAHGNSTRLQYEVKNMGSQMWFYVRTPYAWLNATGRVFPVTVDPTVRVQGPASGTGIGSLTVTMASTPTSGNLMFLICQIYETTGTDQNSVNSISETGVSWSRQNSEWNTPSDGVNNWIDVEIWAGVVNSGSASKTITLSMTDWGSDYAVNSYGMAVVYEYSGLKTSGFLDKVATASDYTVNPGTGTTATTTQASELWLGATLQTTGTTNSTVANNGFNLTSFTGVNIECLTVFNKTVNSVGTATSGTNSTNAFGYYWVGCIATFEALVTAPTYSSLSASSTTANYTCVFGASFNDSTTLQGSGQYEFGWNSSGTWVWDSAVNFSSTPQVVNVTKTLNATVGVTISYMWNCSDNYGSTNSTGVLNLVTSGYVVAPSNDTGSTITPSSNLTVCYGADQTFSYSSQSGYNVTQVLVDGSAINLTTYPTSYSFSDIQQNHTISVSSTATYAVTLSVSGGNPTVPIQTTETVFVSVTKGNQAFSNYNCNVTRDGSLYAQNINAQFQDFEPNIVKRTFLVTGLFDKDSNTSVGFTTASFDVTWYDPNSGGGSGGSSTLPNNNISPTGTSFEVESLNLGTVRANSTVNVNLVFSYAGSSFYLTSLTLPEPFQNWYIPNSTFTTLNYVQTTSGVNTGYVALTFEIPGNVSVTSFNGVFSLTGVDAFGVKHTSSGQIQVNGTPAGSNLVDQVGNWIRSNFVLFAIIVVIVMGVAFASVILYGRR